MELDDIRSREVVEVLDGDFRLPRLAGALADARQERIAELTEVGDVHPLRERDEAEVGVCDRDDREPGCRSEL
jgi:hypothetical protein